MNEDGTYQVQQPLAPPSTVAETFISVETDQATALSDELHPTVRPSENDSIPLIRLPPKNAEFLSFSQLSEFLKNAPLIFPSFTKLYGKPRHNIRSLMVVENAESLRSAFHGIDTSHDVGNAIDNDILDFGL